MKGHFHIFTMSFFFIIRLAEERIWYLTKYKKVTKNKNYNETTKMPFKAKKKKLKLVLRDFFIFSQCFFSHDFSL
jgi:hypothetical protein